MNGAVLRRRLEIDNPHVTDAELEQAARQIARYVGLRRRQAEGWADTEQWEVEAQVALWHAARTFDPAGRASFPTHATNWAVWIIGKESRVMMPLGLKAARARKRREQRGEPLEAVFTPPLSLDADPDAREYLRSLAVTDPPIVPEGDRWEQIVAHLPLLSETQRRHLEAWMRTGTTRAAAAECGCSRQGISNSLARARTVLLPLLAREP